MNRVKFEASCLPRKLPKPIEIAIPRDAVKTRNQMTRKDLLVRRCCNFLALVFAYIIVINPFLGEALAFPTPLNADLSQNREARSPLLWRIDVKTRGAHGEVLSQQEIEISALQLETKPISIGGLVLNFKALLESNALSTPYQIRVEKTGSKGNKPFVFHMQNTSFLTLLGKRPGILTELRISRPPSQDDLPSKRSKLSIPTNHRPHEWTSDQVKPNSSYWGFAKQVNIKKRSVLPKVVPQNTFFREFNIDARSIF